MKQILVCTDGSTFSYSSYHYAAWFANRMPAAVDVLHITDARSRAAAEARNFSGTIGLGASETLLNQLVSLEQEKAKLDHQRAILILQEAQNALGSQGVEGIRLIHETGFLVDWLETFEAETDLIILGKRGETAEFASRHLGANLERIIRASQKPCLVTSRQIRDITRLLLAYDGSITGQRILKWLDSIPALQGLEMHIITVAKSEDDPTAQAHLQEAVQLAQQAGFAPISQVLLGHPETAIAHYNEAKNIDLLLMGAYGHSRIRHLVIGSTTAQILRSSNIPVLVFR
jgi:nucleotide-binding universal stress UspA family protein